MKHITVRRTGLLLGLITILGAAASLSARAADLEVGQPAPDFQLPDENGVVRSLANFKGKTLVLAFYPKDFTGG